MIEKFVARFMERKPIIREKFSKKCPEHYTDIVKAVVEELADVYDYDSPDPDRIHSIDDGDYQGTLLYLIAAEGYQPSVYWYVFVYYGSCSGCDALEDVKLCYRIDEYGEGPVNEEGLDMLMQLALNVVQGMKKISPYDQNS